MLPAPCRGPAAVVQYSYLPGVISILLQRLSVVDYMHRLSGTDLPRSPYSSVFIRHPDLVGALHHIPVSGHYFPGEPGMYGSQPNRFNTVFRELPSYCYLGGEHLANGRKKSSKKKALFQDYQSLSIIAFSPRYTGGREVPNALSYTVIAAPRAVEFSMLLTNTLLSGSRAASMRTKLSFRAKPPVM